MSLRSLLVSSAHKNSEMERLRWTGMTTLAKSLCPSTFIFMIMLPVAYCLISKVETHERIVDA